MWSFICGSDCTPLAHYLFHREFVLFSSYEALRHIATQDNLIARQASWVAYLQHFTFVLKHKLGTSNRVTDALSRRALVVSDLRISVLELELLGEAYADDHFFTLILLHIAVREPSDFVLVDGFLFKDTRLCILDMSLRLRLISELS